MYVSRPNKLIIFFDVCTSTSRVAHCISPSSCRPNFVVKLSLWGGALRHRAVKSGKLHFTPSNLQLPDRSTDHLFMHMVFISVTRTVQYCMFAWMMVTPGRTFRFVKHYVRDSIPQSWVTQKTNQLILHKFCWPVLTSLISLSGTPLERWSTTTVWTRSSFCGGSAPRLIMLTSDASKVEKIS